MGQVTVTVNKHSYTLACRDGEEERLRALAAAVDEKADSLAERIGQVGEARLMLMVALLLADEADELRRGGAERRATEILEDANSRLEGIVGRLESA